MQYLTESVWKEFEDKFPDGMSFLRHQNLLGELYVLRRLPNPNAWQRKRLAELEWWRIKIDEGGE